MSLANKITKRILERYHQGQCTPEEITLVESYFEQLQIGGIQAADVQKDLHLRNKLHKKIINELGPVQKNWNLSRIAAVAIILIAATLFAFFYNHQTVAYKTVIATYGKPLRLQLSDASVVYLSAGSTLVYPENFEGLTKRAIQLDGKAFFEVTKNPTQPFVVTSGNIATTVLGTKFIVNSFDQSKPSVVVTEGKVNVTYTRDQTASIDIIPNERVVLNAGQKRFVKNQVRAKDYAAWIDGSVVFNDANLSEIVAILNRRFNRNVTATNMANCQIRGKYSGNNLDELLKSIKFIHGITYQYTSKGILLDGMNCK